MIGCKLHFKKHDISDWSLIGGVIIQWQWNRDAFVLTSSARFSEIIQMTADNTNSQMYSSSPWIWFVQHVLISRTVQNHSGTKRQKKVVVSPTELGELYCFARCSVVMKRGSVWDHSAVILSSVRIRKKKHFYINITTSLIEYFPN